MNISVDFFLPFAMFSAYQTCKCSQVHSFLDLLAKIQCENFFFIIWISTCEVPRTNLNAF